MSASDLDLSKAIEAAAADLDTDSRYKEEYRSDEISEKVIRAALPHIRRAVIEELAEKAEREAESLLMNGEPDWVSADEANRYTRATEGARWLRAEAKDVGA